MFIKLTLENQDTKNSHTKLVEINMTRRAEGILGMNFEVCG